MKAVLVTRSGGPEVLEVRDVPEPQPAPGEVIVCVEAVGINFADTMTTRGTYGGMPPPPFISGREFAGVVEGTGERVMGYMQWGAAAQKIAMKPQLLWPQPKGWTSAQSAAFPVNFLTAYLAYWKAGLTSDALEPILWNDTHQRRVLIHAAAGGVGTAAVEIGKLLGIETYGTSSSDEKLERVKKLGLDRGINYREVDYEQRMKELTNGEGVDAVFEMLGGEHTAKSLRCCRPFGRVIIYGTATGQRQQFDAGVMMARSLSAHGLWLSVLAKDPELIDRSLQAMQPWIEQGKLHPEIGHTLPMEQAGDAHRLLLQRANYGKIVLLIQ
jgi:NADPH:quinone reductase